MASLKDKLVKMAGGNMAESMGARSGAGSDMAQAPDPGAVPPGSARVASGRYDGVKAFREARLIPIDKLVPDPDQPRKTFTDESIDRLADSLRARGMLQPVRARWDTDLGRWVIVAGERRFRAARRAGWTEVPCVVVEAAMTATAVRLDQLVENALREDVPPLEQAAAFQTLIDENGWSARRLSEELHLSPQTILRALDLLALPGPVREKVSRGEIAPRTAAEIATLADPAEQIALADQVAAEKLSRDAVSEVIRARKLGAPAPSPRASRVREEIQLDDGTRIVVTGPAAGAGPEAVVSALKRALKQLQSRPRGADPGQAA
jgi:ParB family chromosome partitioning protein